MNEASPRSQGSHLTISRRAALQLGVVAVAALAAWLPVPASVVERWYATGLYPILQRLITPVSNAIPFAIFDLLILGGAAGLAWVLWRGARSARRARRLGPLLSALGTVGAIAAGAYVVFLLLWGLNYRREGMSERLVVADEPAHAGEVVALGLHAVSQMNQLHADAHRTGWSQAPWRDPELVEAFHDTQQMLSDARPATPGRLKWSILGLYFRWASIDGMIDPFALEVLANPDLLPWEGPFVAAHEWAHLAGYAHEAEANFVGWLMCVRGDAGARYSGWLHVYWQVAGTVGPDDRERLAEALEPGPRRDITAIYDRITRGRLSLLHDASWGVYDQYLRAHRVEGGVRSYGEVVDLILRARFEDGWVPVRRSQPATVRE